MECTTPLFANTFKSEVKLEKGIIDLHKTFNCGQSFRWFRVELGGAPKNSQNYFGIIGNTPLYLSYNPAYCSLHTSLSQENLKSVATYLGLVDNYRPLHLDRNLTDYEKQVIKTGMGIRILHQDFWESLITFIISQRNSIPRITKTIQTLCVVSGTPITDPVTKQTVHAFPTPLQILSNKDAIYNRCSLGYRYEYIIEACYSFKPLYKEITDNPKMSTTELIQCLRSIKGVGDKVANCTALFGLHRLDAFPIDTHIQKIITREYSSKNIPLLPEKFHGLAGLMQQYMFFNERFIK